MQGGWMIQAALGRTASYASQRFRPAEPISIEFCLRASRGANTKVLGLQPGGISLELHANHLVLQSTGTGQIHAAARMLTVSGHPVVVELKVNGSGRRVELYADGVDQGWFVGNGFAPSVVALGSLARARPGWILLTGVTVTTRLGRVIPAPSPGATPPASSAPGAPTNSGTTTISPTAPPTSASIGAQGTDGSAASCLAQPADFPAPWPGNAFSPTSFWNTPLAATAPLDSNSQAYVNELVRQVNVYGSWMNTTSYSAPVYVVPADEPMQHVTLDEYGPALQAAFDAVPIPCDASAAAGSDEHMVVWQPSTDRMWEFWQMHQASDGWHAAWGGEMDHVSTNPGYFDPASGEDPHWGATATALPLLGGLVTEADLQRGYINHALAISLVETEPSYWSWPAQRTDGGYFTAGITPIPEGTRFRLDPTLNIASLDLPPIDAMLAQAAQTYGIVVRDKSGVVVFYGQDPVNLPSNPWPAAFENQYPNQVLAQFPWSHLQALQTQLSCCWSPSQ
ncbi:MAG: hypothetical protein JO130_04620 [Solirubrobacterales bacterium]|nr:hypothetical protein [Solirubrobacterales bacterium]